MNSQPLPLWALLGIAIAAIWVVFKVTKTFVKTLLFAALVAALVIVYLKYF